jgi:hypothetical protein
MYLVSVDPMDRSHIQLHQLLKLRKNWGRNWGKQDWWFGGLMSRTRYIALIICSLQLEQPEKLSRLN